MLLCSCTSLRIIDSHQGGPASQKDFDPSTDAVSVTFAVLSLTVTEGGCGGCVGSQQSLLI